MKLKLRPVGQKGLEDKPCAVAGLTSYRCRGCFGRIMIGATDDADAWREARRSTDAPAGMEVWNGREYVPVDAPSGRGRVGE